jgi:hypothetical protein
MYNYCHKSSEWEPKTYVNTFGAAFFMVSWLLSQYFRVRKQVGVDKNLSTIEARVEAVIAKLEKHTEDFEGYLTGGDSVAYFIPSFDMGNRNTIILSMMNSSKYPVHDISVELVDIDEDRGGDNRVPYTRIPFNLPALQPNKAVVKAYVFQVPEKDKLRLNVFIQSRNNKNLIQYIRICRSGDGWIMANIVKMGDEIIFKQVPLDYPGYDPEKPDADF